MKYNKISIVMHTFMDKWNVKTCLCYIEREWRRQDPVMSVRSTETKLILFKKKKKKDKLIFLNSTPETSRKRLHKDVWMIRVRPGRLNKA